MRITHFIEKRRRQKGILKIEFCKMLGISMQVYRRRLVNGGLNDDEIQTAARVLDFELQVVNEENKLK